MFLFTKLYCALATVFILLILLIKSNLLRLKGGFIGGIFALILLSGILASTTVAVGSIVYAYRVKNKLNNQENPVDDLEAISV